jgi:hypothetical protein
VIGAAKDIGSLFTSQNPAATEAANQISGAVKSVLPQTSDAPKFPAASYGEFKKLPQDQQDAYLKQYEEWKAGQGAASMQTVLGLLVQRRRRQAPKRQRTSSHQG